jgi:hypothetical protein
VTACEGPNSGRWPLSRLITWAARPLRQLSDRVHVGGESIARSNGWEITSTTGRFGLGVRTYHDPRFAHRAVSTEPPIPGVGMAGAPWGQPGVASVPMTHHESAADRGEGTHV